jgi:cob(I)alamin adenosyltransferase
MKIYTKTGDKGQTSLLGGSRVDKHHIRIESYGSTDELNSWIGLLRSGNIKATEQAVLLEVQDRLFTMGSWLAMERNTGISLPALREEDVSYLESEIDRMDSELEPMRHFILPGGNEDVARIHIARCVCRRAERCIMHLHATEPVDEVIIRYINRLSDYLFTLARYVGNQGGIKEDAWVPRK